MAGGLTALPSTTFGANLLANPGFETVSASLPASWSSGGGWSVDQVVKRSGQFSYRWTTGSPTVAQRLTLPKGVYDVSGWVTVDTPVDANRSYGQRIPKSLKMSAFKLCAASSAQTQPIAVSR